LPNFGKLRYRKLRLGLRFAGGVLSQGSDKVVLLGRRKGRRPFGETLASLLRQISALDTGVLDGGRVGRDGRPSREQKASLSLAKIAADPNGVSKTLATLDWMDEQIASYPAS